MIEKEDEVRRLESANDQKILARHTPVKESALVFASTLGQKTEEKLNQSSSIPARRGKEDTNIQNVLEDSFFAPEEAYTDERASTSLGQIYNCPIIQNEQQRWSEMEEHLRLGNMHTYNALNPYKNVSTHEVEGNNDSVHIRNMKTQAAGGFESSSVVISDDLNGTPFTTDCNPLDADAAQRRMKWSFLLGIDKS